MRYIVAGGRDFADEERLNEILENTFHWLNKDEILCGMAAGADTLGRLYAEERGMIVYKYPADWDKYGKAAGCIRNQQMAQKADALIAFWDGKSKGTKHMIETATRCGLEIHIYRY